MKHPHRRGLVLLLVTGSLGLVGASPALAQSGPSNNGSTAQTEYAEPTPSTTTPLVPAGTPAPDSGTLPSTDESDAPASGAPASGGPDAPASGGPDTPSGQPAAGGAPGPENVTTRESGAEPAPVAQAAGSLPFTGGSALPIAAGGLLLLLAGGLMRRRLA